MMIKHQGILNHRMNQKRTTRWRNDFGIAYRDELSLYISSKEGVLLII